MKVWFIISTLVLTTGIFWNVCSADRILTGGETVKLMKCLNGEQLEYKQLRGNLGQSGVERVCFP